MPYKRVIAYCCDFLDTDPFLCFYCHRCPTLPQPTEHLHPVSLENYNFLFNLNQEFIVVLKSTRKCIVIPENVEWALLSASRAIYCVIVNTEEKPLMLRIISVMREKKQWPGICAVVRHCMFQVMFFLRNVVGILTIECKGASHIVA